MLPSLEPPNTNSKPVPQHTYVSLLPAKQQEVTKDLSDFESFVSPSVPREEWNNVNIHSAPGTDIDLLLVGDGIAKNGCYKIESRRESITEKCAITKNTCLFDEFATVPFFAQCFYGTEHTTYWCKKKGNPIVISVEDPTSSSRLRRVIIRTAHGDSRTMIEHFTKGGDILALHTHVPFLKHVKLSSSRSLLLEELLMYEGIRLQHKYKIGVLYAGPGQFDEFSIFSNKQGSPAYEEFLSLLGERIKLRGWKGYAADDETGTESLYTTFSSGDIDIMYHVATMLPFTPGDKQQLNRKRHIGNDVVVIIFKDRENISDVIDLNSFVSKFNQVFYIVSPENCQGKTYYRVNLAIKSSVPPFPPFLPTPSLFEITPEFGIFTITKSLNAERFYYDNAQVIVSSKKERLSDAIKAAKKRK